MAKFSQKTILDGEVVIVMAHNVETKEEALDVIENAQPLCSDDITEYEGVKFLHLNTGLGIDKLKFTKDRTRAGASTSCVGEYEEF